MRLFKKFNYYFKAIKNKEIFQKKIIFRFDEVEIKLPCPANHFFKKIYFVFFKRDCISLSKELCERTSEEPLLRSLSAKYLASEFCPKNSSIIDIGSWIGDNSCPLAKATLKKNIKVFDIDKSKKNN